MTNSRSAKRFSYPLLILAAVILLVLIAVTKQLRLPGQVGSPFALIQKEDIQYKGAFALPSGGKRYGATFFGYGGGAITPYTDSSGVKTLYLRGHDQYPNNIAQIKIPALGTGAAFSSLKRAEVLQNFYDITDGQATVLGKTLGTTMYVGGLLPYNNRLISNVYGFYDGLGRQTASHGVSGFNLAQSGDFKGLYKLGTTGAGFVSGYMTLIPQEWRAALGGPALTGNCCLNIITRTSSGPAASVFNPDDVGVVDPVPATQVIGYPSDKPVPGGAYGATSNIFNATTRIVGIAFPKNSSSVLFFGTHGIGTFCNGVGGATKPKLAAGEVWCYDPAVTARGVHAYPYQFQVWAYDANDLVAVKNGQKQSYEIAPYATWKLEGMDKYSSSVSMTGAGFDPETNVLYVTQGNQNNPIIHAFQITVPELKPSAPENPTSSARAPVVVASGSLTTGWATFGQVFPQGVVKDGLRIGTLSTQVDVKTRYPDGSIKYAILTAKIPETGHYDITDGGSISGTMNAVLPTAFVRFAIGGIQYTATLPNTPSSDVWLNGALVKEQRYRVVPISSTGTAHPYLDVLFDVRSYQDGSSTVDVTAQNILNKTGATTMVYDVDIVINNETVFQRATVNHYWMTRWRKVFAVGPMVESQVTLDFKNFYLANALPEFLKTITNTVPSMGATFDILKNGALNPEMGDVGGRPEIAPIPDWGARFLVHKTQAQRDYVLANGDLAASWPMHIEEATGGLLTIDAHPSFWLDYRGDAGNKPLGTSLSPLHPEINHMPTIAYLPYLITGDRFYADEMKYWGNYALIGSYQNLYQSGRCSAEGIKANKNTCGSEGLLRSNQVRGIAWGLRAITDAASYLPDAEPLKAYFANKVSNNMKWFDDYAATQLSPIGASFEDKRPENASKPPYMWIAQWEQNYLTWAIDHAHKQGFLNGDSLLDRMGKFQLSLFTSSPDYPREYGAPYTIVTGTKVSGVTTYYTSLKQVFDVYFASTNRAPVQFAGYYGSDARMILMIGIEKGWAGAQEAYDYLTPFIANAIFTNGVSDLNNRAGWALALPGSTMNN